MWSGGLGLLLGELGTDLAPVDRFRVRGEEDVGVGTTTGVTEGVKYHPSPRVCRGLEGAESEVDAGRRVLLFVGSGTSVPVACPWTRTSEKDAREEAEVDRVCVRAVVIGAWVGEVAVTGLAAPPWEGLRSCCDGRADDDSSCP